jgi:hypothetical protein
MVSWARGPGNKPKTCCLRLSVPQAEDAGVPGCKSVLQVRHIRIAAACKQACQSQQAATVVCGDMSNTTMRGMKAAQELHDELNSVVSVLKGKPPIKPDNFGPARRKT